MPDGAVPGLRPATALAGWQSIDFSGKGGAGRGSNNSMIRRKTSTMAVAGRSGRRVNFPDQSDAGVGSNAFSGRPVR
jgi:hypothetical protein